MKLSARKEKEDMRIPVSSGNRMTRQIPPPPGGLFVLPVSAKIFLSLMLVLAGLCYLSLLAGIWYDTGMELALIIEAYAGMGAIELVQHSFRHLFWFFGIFAVTGGLFLATRAAESVKRLLACLLPLLIMADIASAWLVSASPFFAGLLFFCGFMLALLFFCLFVAIQRDLWIEPAPLRDKD